MQALKRVALIKGDGVGPELLEAAQVVLDAVKPKIDFVECDAGYEWWQVHGGDSFIPDDTWEKLKNSDACLKAPMTTPSISGAPRSVVVSIRQKFDLYANIRPIKTFKGYEGPLGKVDFVCVRETTEGLYSGIEHKIGDDAAIAVRKITRRQSEKVARKAFEVAQDRGWRKVIVVTKRNIMRECDGIFVESVEKVSRGFPNVAYEEYYIDNLAQQLVKNPQRFDQNVILGTNLFMDIISEEASGLVGSIGCIYSGNFGDSYALFEPAHGSAPKYKGLNKVNPTAMILSAGWMLEYLGEKRLSQAVFAATEEVIAGREHVTYDLGGRATMMEMAKAIADKAKGFINR
ncbi:MAG: isocitrate/isopropylmalate dehydrogenase family protein [Nitrososphaeria archaeon]